MISLSKYLDRKNLHHAYLIEGRREDIVPQLIDFLQEIEVNTTSSDFVRIETDSFKMEDAKNLKSLAGDKSFSSTPKIFLLAVNNFLLEAQNSMLKIFEEPIANTHFFIIVPDLNSLLGTFVSRFFVISFKEGSTEDKKEAEKFIKMNFEERLEYVKNLLTEPEETEDRAVLDGARVKALQFLNALEVVLHQLHVSNGSLTEESALCLNHIFKVRRFIRMPGSSAKSLMESVALLVPRYK